MCHANLYDAFIGCKVKMTEKTSANKLKPISFLKKIKTNKQQKNIVV